jgi:thiol-disulfide isomerase/thioredoxin
MDAHAEARRPDHSTESAAARTWIIAAAATLLLVAVVGGVLVARDSDGIDASSTSTTSDEPAQAAEADARPIPEFTADLRDGGTLDSADITGPAMIQVFASWCPSCQAHAPLVAQVQDEFDGLETYYVNVADDAEPAAGFIAEHDWATSPVLVDDDRSIASAFGVTGQPHTIFIDADGNVADVLEGGGELGALQAAAERVTAS